MHLEESGQMYLETILILSKKNSFVRSIDVAEHMGYSKPSVSRAVGILKNAELLTMDSDGALHLTEEGRQIAEKIFERHSVLSQFLMALGVDEKNALDDACKMEHDISDESFYAIKKFNESMNEK